MASHATHAVLAAGTLAAAVCLAGCGHGAATPGALPATPTASPTASPSSTATAASASPAAPSSTETPADTRELSAPELLARAIDANLSLGAVTAAPVVITGTRTATLDLPAGRQTEETAFRQAVGTSPFAYELTESITHGPETGETRTFAETTSDPHLGDGYLIYRQADPGGEWVKDFAAPDAFEAEASALFEARSLPLLLNAVAAQPDTLEATRSDSTITLASRPTGDTRQVLAEAAFGQLLTATGGTFEADAATLAVTLDAATLAILSYSLDAAGSGGEPAVSLTLRSEGSIDHEPGPAPVTIPAEARVDAFG